MANLQKCSRCKSEVDISYFGLNRKPQPYKTCETCRNNRSVIKQTDSANTIQNALTLIATATQQLEGIVTDEATPSDTDNKSTTAESSTPPEPINEKCIIVMDCETNGLIKQRGVNPTPTNLNMCPRIVQFSWGLYTETGECKEIKDFIIKPNGWTMNGSDRCHGITQTRATAEGVDILDVLAKYKYDIDNHCCKLVCHNVDFDKRVVQGEFLRANLELTNVETYCTMKKAINYCKLLPNMRGEYKWPSLEELYRKCVNEDLENAHNSYYDVVNCARAYFELQK